MSSLVELADADAMKESLGLARRQALWAIKALRDEPRTGVGRRLLA